MKERLHHLVDALPESEAPTAARILEALVATADPVLRAHLLAPEDRPRPSPPAWPGSRLRRFRI